MNTASEFQAVWRFRVEPARIARFIAAYGPDGAWAGLFRLSPHYLSTTLLRDAADPHVFLTIDRWTSLAAYRAFGTEFAADYAHIDERCSELTVSEELLFEGTAVRDAHQAPPGS